MKINKIFILSLLLITMLASFGFASSFESYGIQGWKGASDSETYNLRTVSVNNIESTDNLQSCSVGYGSTMGVYPIFQQVNSIKYNYLLVPTSSSIKLINSECGEIDSIALNNVVFYGTLGTIGGSTGIYEKYVLMGYNTTSAKYGFYAFSINPDSTNLEFNSYMEIPDVISTTAFNGVGCGYIKRNIPDLGFCGLSNGGKLYIWNLVSNNLSIKTMTYSMNRALSQYMPSASVVDFDNDENNEIVIGSMSYSLNSNTYVYYISYDVFHNTFDKQVRMTILSGYSRGFMDGDNVVPVIPCQVGGASSELEICAQFQYKDYQVVEHTYIFHGVLDQANTWYGLATYDESNPHIFTLASGLFTDISANKGVMIPERADYQNNIDLKFYKYDYSGVDFTVTIGTTNNPTTTQVLLSDINNDGFQDVILSTGDIYSLTNGSKFAYHLPYLAESSKGYLIAGDLNNDYTNEIIYSDSSNIYIYSTNPTAEYMKDESIPIPYAYDLDGGIVYTESNYAFNGTTTNEINHNTTVAYDTCSTSNPNVVQEYYLSGYNVLSLLYDCTAGGYYSCITGMCVNESYYNFIEEGIQNGTIDSISGGWISGEPSSPATPTEEPEINFVLDSLSNNIKMIFALFLIAGVVVLTAKQTKSPIVLIFVGIITTILMSFLGMIPAVVLIVILIALVVLMLLAFATNRSGN